MRPFIRRGITAVTALLALVAFLLSQAPPAAAADVPYLRVWTDRPEAETLTVFHVYVDSKVLVNESGNLTLVPNPGTVNVTLTDVAHGVVVRTSLEHLFNGTLDLPVVVEPAWTTAYLNISVFDAEHGLVGFANLQARLSDEWLLYLMRLNWANDVRDWWASVRAEDAAQDTFERALFVTFDAAWALLLLLVFLRWDHRRSRSVGLPSLWDRFAARAWPYSLIPDDFGTWIDPERTWDRPTAEGWKDRRVRQAIRRIRARQVEDDELVEDILSGKVVIE